MSQPRIFGYAAIAPKYGKQDDLEAQVKHIKDYALTCEGYEAAAMVSETADLLARAFRVRANGHKLYRILDKGDLLVISDGLKAFSSLKDMVETAHELRGKGVDLVVLDALIDTRNEVGMFVFKRYIYANEFGKSRYKRAWWLYPYLKGKAGDWILSTQLREVARECIELYAAGLNDRMIWLRFIDKPTERKPIGCKEWSGNRIWDLRQMEAKLQMIEERHPDFELPRVLTPAVEHVLRVYLAEVGKKGLPMDAKVV